MTIHQLSIFIENKSGAMVKVLDILKRAQIQIIASTIADTADYGIFRIICPEPARAYTILKEKGISVALSDVFAITLNDTPGSAADAISTFAKEEINISYLYSFLLGKKGVLIFRTDNTEKAKETVILNKLEFITEQDLIGYK